MTVAVAPHQVYGPRDNLFMPNMLEVKARTHQSMKDYIPVTEHHTIVKAAKNTQ
jgi:hypothetical protein